MSTVAAIHPPLASRVAPRRPLMSSTRLGMWWFLGSEVGTFGGVVVSYVMMRLYHTEWAHEAAHTLLPIGIINTIVLLTSSLSMVLAHQAAEEKQTDKARKMLLITLGLGALFLCFKSFEYYHEISGGHVPKASLFWSFYYAMTGLHCLHIVAGLVMMLYLLAGFSKPFVLARVAPIGLYWHFVDIVWILLFPLLYVTAH